MIVDPNFLYLIRFWNYERRKIIVSYVDSIDAEENMRSAYKPCNKHSRKCTTDYLNQAFLFI